MHEIIEKPSPMLPKIPSPCFVECLQLHALSWSNDGLMGIC